MDIYDAKGFVGSNISILWKELMKRDLVLVHECGRYIYIVKKGL